MVQKRDCLSNTAKNLRFLLKQRGITQERFAEMAYVDARTVRRWTSVGINQLNQLERVARLLQVSVVDFVGSDADEILFLKKRTCFALVR